MAITINRNSEISDKDFRILKRKFKERTYTRALYRCVEFVVNKVPNYEKKVKKLERENKKLERENKKLKVKHEQLIEIIIQKHPFDQIHDDIVYPAEIE